MTAVLTAPEVADRLRIAEGTVRKMARAHKIPCTRIGNRFRWTEEQYAEILRILEQPVAVTEPSLVGARSRGRRSA